MRLDTAPLCLRNDGGTLIWPTTTAEKLLWRGCDVCGDGYTIEVLELAIKSTWEALRLGLMPLESRGWGDVRLSVAFGKHGPLITQSTVEFLENVDPMFHVEHG